MSKAVIYSQSTHAVDVFSQILNAEDFASIDVKEDVAFCGVDSEATLQLINPAENFDAAVKLALKPVSASSAAVILLADAENCAAQGAQLRENGVIVVEKPLTRQLFVQSVQDGVALQGRIRRMGDQLEETRKICRAKLILVEQQHMTEQQAHKYIEKEAMNRRITRLQLANELINAHS